MKWKYHKHNNNGKRRKRKFFAIIPYSLGGYTYWLQYVTLLEQHYPHYGWCPVCVV